MKTENLKEYLDIVVDMEKSVFFQNTLEYFIKKQMKDLEDYEKNKVFIRPTAPQEKKVVDQVKFYGTAYFFMIAGLFGLFLIILPLLGGLWSFGPFGIFCALLFTVPGVCLVSRGIEAVRDYTKEEKKCEDEKKDYEKKYAEYNKQKEEFQVQVEKNYSVRSYYSNLLREVQKKRDRSKAVLENIYSEGIIYYKYRNLPMVSTIYEYIATGRCSTLEGYEGAYNLLETEMRLDRIVTSLDKILLKLDQLQRTQYMLYNIIQDSNIQLKQIVSSINNMSEQMTNIHNKISSIDKNSDLSAYYLERSQKELEYMNRIKQEKK